MKKFSTALLFLCALVVDARVVYKPTFNDPPVPASHITRIDEALPREPIVVPKTERRILVVSATAGFHHASIPTAKLAIEKLGISSGAYRAITSDDPANFEPDVLRTFDAVLLLNTTQDFFVPNKKTHRRKYNASEWDALEKRHHRLIDNLIDYVEQGGGLAGIHAATDSCYSHRGYGAAIGAYFDGHPWSAGHNVTIVVEDSQHALIRPVFEGIKDFRIQEEIYQFSSQPYSRERLRVLLHLDPARSDSIRQKLKREDGDYPVCWVQGFGEGRVFYSSLGHNHHIYWNPLILKHFLAGLQFVAGDLEADTTPSAKLQLPNIRACDQ